MVSEEENKKLLEKLGEEDWHKGSFANTISSLTTTFYALAVMSVAMSVATQTLKSVDTKDKKKKNNKRDKKIKWCPLNS